MKHEMEIRYQRAEIDAGRFSTHLVNKNQNQPEEFHGLVRAFQAYMDSLSLENYSLVEGRLKIETNLESRRLTRK